MRIATMTGLGTMLAATGALAQPATMPRTPPVISTVPAKDLTVSPVLAGPTTDLTVTVNGSGNVDAPSLLCDVKGSQTSKVCKRPLSKDKAVTLTATPAAGMKFVGWAGACTGMSPTCVVAMNKTTTVAATFMEAATGTRTLTVRANEGTTLDIFLELTPQSKFLCNPQGQPPGQQNWITTCTAVVPTGTTVTVHGTWAVGLTGLGQFKVKPEEWNKGCDAVSKDGCMMVMSDDRSLLVTRQ